jgi:hypothetical protein
LLKKDVIFIQPLTEPAELTFLKILNMRMELTSNDKRKLINLEKGYIGEQIFSGRLQEICSPDESILLHSLLLECSNTVFQIDSLLITKHAIYLFEVKNFEGDCYLEGDKWYNSTGIEINSPVLQLSRCDSLFRRLLQEIGFKIPVKPFIIFINPEFTLYNAPMNHPIIFPTQLNRFLTKLKSNFTPLNKNHVNLAKKLIAAQIDDSPYSRLPRYEYEQLAKGVLCCRCNSFITTITKMYLFCGKCGHKEKIVTGIKRNVDQYMLLFPNKKITTNSIQEWCKIIDSKKIIRKALNDNFNGKGHGKGSYYDN